MAEHYKYRYHGLIRDVFSRNPDKLTLKRALLAFKRCEALMPDGSWVEYPEGGNIPSGSVAETRRSFGG